MSDTDDQKLRGTRANELVKELEAMDMFERSEFMRIITEPFCKHCWCADPYCQCWNDE